MLGGFVVFRLRLWVLACAGFAVCTAAAQWRTYILLPPGATQSYAGGVSGEIVVGYAVFGGVQKPVAWIGTSGTYVLLDTPSGEGFASGIQGNVICGAVKVNGVSHAVIWPTLFSKYIDLNGTSTSSYLLGIGGNQQVGSSDLGPTLWTGTAGSAVSLTPAGSTTSSVYATDGLQQVGTAGFGFGLRAIVWSGTASSFVDLTGANLASATAYDVDAGTQVGEAWIRYGTLEVLGAALWKGTPDSFVSLDPYVSSQGKAWGVFEGSQLGRLSTAGGNTRAAMWHGSPTNWEDLHCYLPESVYRSEAFSMNVQDGVARVLGQAGPAQSGLAVLWVSEQAVERAPTGYSVEQGIQAHGNIISLRRSDDDWAVVMVEGSESAEFVFEGSAPSGAFTRMVFALDGHSSEMQTQFQIYLYDFQENSWVLSRSGTLEPSFDYPVCAIVDPERFMSPGTRRVRSKVVVTLPSGNAGSIWVDRVRWVFSP